MASRLLTTFFLLIFFLVLVSPCDASPSPISSAVEVLSNSAYFSMKLTLQLANNDLSLDDLQELTIFAPSDQAFVQFGQPSLRDIKFQLSPTRLHGETLRNLPIGAKIPTLVSNSFLTVTNSSLSGVKLSINNVVVQDSPVFDDGFLVIYGADEFFTSASSSNSPSSSIPNPIPSSATRTAPIPNFAVPPPSESSQNPPNRSKPVNCFNIFGSASSLLMSRGFVVMATFLALQLQTSENNTKLTIFAPIDDAIPNTTTKFSDYATIFRRHVIQRLLSWKDLQNLAWEGSILQNVLKGYEIELSWYSDILLLNGVPLIYPDLYVNEWIAVHGLNQMIEPQANQVKQEDTFSELNNGEEDGNIPELGDYGLH